MIQPINPERFERLRSLTPLEAVKAMLGGDFGIGDEAAILEAIRKDSRITLSDEEILAFLNKTLIEHGEDAQNCFDKLVAARKPAAM